MVAVVKNSDETRFSGLPLPTRLELQTRPPHTNIYEIYRRFVECRGPLQRDVWVNNRLRGPTGAQNLMPVFDHAGLLTATYYRQVNHPNLYGEYGFNPPPSQLPQITGSWRLTFRDENSALAYYLGFSHFFYHTEGWGGWDD